MHLLTELGTNQEYVLNGVPTKQVAQYIVGLCCNLSNLIIFINIHYCANDDKLRILMITFPCLLTAGMWIQCMLIFLAQKFLPNFYRLIQVAPILFSFGLPNTHPIYILGLGISLVYPDATIASSISYSKVSKWPIRIR